MHRTNGTVFQSFRVRVLLLVVAGLIASVTGLASQPRVALADHYCYTEGYYFDGFNRQPYGNWHLCELESEVPFLIPPPVDGPVRVGCIPPLMCVDGYFYYPYWGYGVYPYTWWNYSPVNFFPYWGYRGYGFTP